MNVETIPPAATSPGPGRSLQVFARVHHASRRFVINLKTAQAPSKLGFGSSALIEWTSKVWLTTRRLDLAR